MTTKVGNNLEVLGNATVDGSATVSGSFTASSTARFPGVGATGSSPNAVISGGNLLISVSSKKYKDNVETLWSNTANNILNLRPIWYRSKCAADNPNWSYYGFIAEEVAQIDPKFVHWIKDENGDLTPESVQYERMIVPLIEIIKRHEETINKLVNEINKLRRPLLK